MKKAFVVTLEVEDDTDFATLAQEIHDTLDYSFYVESVTPWASPGTPPPAPPTKPI